MFNIQDIVIEDVPINANKQINNLKTATNVKTTSMINTTLTTITKTPFNIKNIVIENVANHTNESIKNIKNQSETEIRDYCSTGFLRKRGMKYCKFCGTENDKTDNSCNECNKELFIDSYTSEILGGYIELVKKGKLKTYYNKTMKNNKKINVNIKRMLLTLLIHKNNINIDAAQLRLIYKRNVQS